MFYYRSACLKDNETLAGIVFGVSDSTNKHVLQVTFKPGEGEKLNKCLDNLCGKLQQAWEEDKPSKKSKLKH